MPASEMKATMSLSSDPDYFAFRPEKMRAISWRFSETRDKMTGAAEKSQGIRAEALMH
jgi:hypothetical protein